MKDVRILGLDASTTKTGWCVGDGPDYVASGVINCLTGPGRERDAYGRLQLLAFRLLRLIPKWNPDLVAAEMPRPHRGNMDTDRKMGASIGTVNAVAGLFGLPPVLWIEPQNVRGTLLYKHAPENVAQFIGKPLALLKKRPDECDAVGVWWRAWKEMQEQLLLEEASARWRKLVEGETGV